MRDSQTLLPLPCTPHTLPPGKYPQGGPLRGNKKLKAPQKQQAAGGEGMQQAPKRPHRSALLASRLAAAACAAAAGYPRDRTASFLLLLEPLGAVVDWHGIQLSCHHKIGHGQA